MYVQYPSYSTARSVAQFYREMILQLLERHDFRRDTDRNTKVNQFGAQDKLRLLRRFALDAVTENGSFVDFDLDSLVAYCTMNPSTVADVPEDRVEDLARSTGRCNEAVRVTLRERPRETTRARYSVVCGSA